MKWSERLGIVTVGLVVLGGVALLGITFGGRPALVALAVLSWIAWEIFVLIEEPTEGE